MIRGIVFDFNGTLFWDSKLHDRAWNRFTRLHGLATLSKTEIRTHILGKGNGDILKYVFGKELALDEVNRLTQEKESIYREIVLSDNKYLTLAPGAEELLNYLKVQNFPITIATSSEEVNVDFFFKYLKLNEWFDKDKVVFDNGNFSPKPAPDIFLIAAKNIRIPINNCMILEDSLAGIKSAKCAEAGSVIYVENDSPIDFNEVSEYADHRIHRLDEVINYLGNENE